MTYREARLELNRYSYQLYKQAVKHYKKWLRKQLQRKTLSQ